MDSSSPKTGRTFSLGGMRLDTRATVILVASTLLLLVDHYHRLLPASDFAELVRTKAIERVGYYLVIPLGIIVLGFRDRPSEYGFSIGNWREGLKWTGLIVLLAAPLIFVVARGPEMVDYYARYPGRTLELIGTAALDLIGWEFLFRGFLLFGLLRIMGPTAVVLQAVPFALAHMGKPELETLSTIFGGTLFGWVAWRSRSFLYPFLIHWFVYTWTVVVAHTWPAA